MKIKDLQLSFVKRGNAGRIVVSLLCVATMMIFSEPLLANTENVAVRQQQNQITVKGRVIDEEGTPLIGASILNVKTGQGVTADLDGNFTIIAFADETLDVMYVGYVTVSLKATETPETIVMSIDHQSLDEVVVVGYGTQKKVNLTGAIGIADGDVMKNRPIGNIAQGLQGVVPNLNISFESGAPTSKATFNIRGATSLNGGSALILVDGVETNDLSLLNPQDIESVSVLKDASSAAVYGARAAFGVVLITTKKGNKNQKPQVSYNNNFSWSSPSRLPDGLSSDKWIHAMNQAGVNSGEGAYFSDKQVAAIDAFIKDPTNNPSAFLDANGDYTKKVNGRMQGILIGLMSYIKMQPSCNNTMQASMVVRRTFHTMALLAIKIRLVY